MYKPVTRKDLLTVADRFGVGTAEKVLKLVGAAVKAWPDFAAGAHISSHERERVGGHHHIL